MRALVLALPLLLAACGDGRPAADVTPAPSVDAAPDTVGLGTEAEGAGEAPDRPIAPGSRPETATATISIEGMEEPIDLRLVTVEDTRLPFSTYVPADWAADVLSSGEGDAARFVMGTPPLEGSVHLFVPSEPNQGGADALARAVAESNGGAEPLEGAAPWVRAGYRFGDPALGGSVRVGEHAGTTFYVVVRYPAEMADGFAPRVGLVLDRLRWADDGTGL
ncbi:hypothetical protein [Rubrivirga marina]|uniref:PsbP C-terminal domain-containing protein n=1 Tax=Rubrivirga marina TaxID=1196024 RepID=A0A271IV65_9BACT|nr:hypothetical protein [Rubrivirga marina]PAP75151.1 hypothetical protein BSZ37_01165 [Rubrivirga marina]